MCDIFKDCYIHISPLGLGTERMKLFVNQIKKHGGYVVKKLEEKTLPYITHIAVDGDSVKEVVKEFAANFVNHDRKHVKVMKIEWLSACFKAKSKLDEKLYQVSVPAAATGASTTQMAKKKLAEEPSAATTSGVSPPKKAKFGEDSKKHDYVDVQPSTSKKETGHVTNEAIIKELKKLADAYKNSGDRWRNFAYTKAISAIKEHGSDISSYEEAKSIRGLGDKMASKVWEMIQTGKIKKTEQVCGGEQAKALEIFNNIWGVGSATALQWYNQGFRTLEDIQTKATLTNQQKIGLKYYDDILEKIPRKEVGEIAATVEKVARALCPDLTVIPCGSYRRGKEMCGDIDIVMYHATKDVTKTLLAPLVKKLHENGFITDDLVTVDESGRHKKYYGVCVLPGKKHKHRRLDLFVIPYEERGPALMHYTGSALFNRSIRLVAQQKGMSLTEHALYSKVIRESKDKAEKSEPLPATTEEEIFEYLKLPYKAPEDRD